MMEDDSGDSEDKKMEEDKEEPMEVISMVCLCISSQSRGYLLFVSPAYCLEMTIMLKRHWHLAHDEAVTS